MLFKSTISISQTCTELIEIVKSKDYPMTYNTYGSSWISKVEFYKISQDYENYYFAIVYVKRDEYGLNVTPYIYQVDQYTESSFSSDFMIGGSAGEAFHKNIKPYGNVLNCSPL